MSTQGDGEPIRYSVHASGQVRADIRALHRKAWQAGKGPEFRRRLRQIVDRLREDPAGLGEALYRLPALKILVYVAVVAPLIVHYGVPEERPLVFIRGISELSQL